MNILDDQEIIGVVKEQIGTVIGLDQSDIEENQSFLKMGISSIKTIMIVNRISKKLGIELNPTVMFEYKNVASLSQFIIERFKTGTVLS